MATGELLFGHYAPDVLAGSDAALGDCTLQITFINTAPGAPLPDLEQLFLCPDDGQLPLMCSFVGQANGTLRTAAGVTDGTRPRVRPNQAHRPLGSRRHRQR